MKLIIITFFISYSLLTTAQDGVLDNSFGNAGVARVVLVAPNGATTTAASASDLTKMVIQADGKIIQVGYKDGVNQNDFVVIRYNANGTPDATFGNQTGEGWTVSDLGGNDRAHGVALQRDGKIVVAGETTNAAGKNIIALVRYDVSGFLDNSFGTGGIVKTDINANPCGANTVEIGWITNLATEFIFVGGWGRPGTNEDFAVLRYELSGNLSSGFGTAGVRFTDFAGGDDRVTDIEILDLGSATDRILAGGWARNGAIDVFAMAMCTYFGSIQTSFNTTGKLMGTFAGQGRTLGVDRNLNKIYLTGPSNSTGVFEFTTASYNYNGSVNTTFGGGVVRTDIGTNSIDYSRALLVQCDGKVLVGGEMKNGSNPYNYTIVRYNENGTLDNSFNGSGKFFTNTGNNNNDYGYSGFGLQDNGKILLGGISFTLASFYLRFHPTIIRLNNPSLSLPIATISASNSFICADAGTPVTLTATGGSFYQWTSLFPNGSSFIQYTSGTLNVFSAPVTIIARVRIGNCVGPPSNPINISLGTGPSVSLSPSSGNLCTTSPILLTASATGATIFEWRRDGNIISGVTSSTYAATQSGIYTVSASDGNCYGPISNEAEILGIVPPDLGGTGIYCEGDFVNVGIPQTELTQSYSWIQNGSRVYGPIGGNGGNQSLQFNMVASRQGTYIVESTRPGCNSVYSNYVYVGFTAITNLVITNLCSTSVSFTWDRVVPAQVQQRYEYSVTTSPSPPISGSSTSDNFGVELPLIPGTTYFIHARVACGFDLSGFGNWYTTSFTTPAAAPTPTLSPASASFCQGGSQLLTATGGDTYQWTRDGITITGVNSSTYTASVAGIYRVYAYTNSCNQSSTGSNTSVITVTALPTGTISPASATICSGSSQLLTATGGTSYQWSRNGSSISGATSATYSATLAGTYSVIITNNGCSAAALNTSEITVTSLPTSTISPASATICSGSSQLLTATGGTSYQWSRNGTPIGGATLATYSATLAGTYSVVVTNNGCSAVASNTAVITVNPVSTSTSNIAICTNQLPFTWNGNSYSAAGSYNVTLTGSNSCDSIATLNLTVNAVLTSTTNASVCTNQLPFTWNGNNYNITGSYNVTLTSQSGCDSIATLNLTVNQVLSSTTNASTCINQLPYVWNGNNYNTTGSYTVTLTSQSGCDSIATLNLTVKPVLTSTTTVETCTNELPYVWNGNNYTASGSYNVTLIGSNGCDSIATLNLTVKPTTSSTTNLTICNNQLPYTWNGNSYSAAGTYNVTLTGTNGCDSIATLNLTVNTVLTSIINVSVCSNQLPYLWNGVNYNITGSYNVTLTSQSGCDSIATLNLTVNQVLSSTTNASICSNQLPYVWNGNNYSTTGSYNVTLTSQSGCDSIATLNLTVKPVLTSTTTASTCTNQLPYNWNGNNYTVSGSYNITLVGSNGCDSVATLNLTIKPTTSSTTNVTICTNQLPYTWNGNSYSAAGSFNVTLTGSNGCDSIATLNLTVNAVLTSTTNVSVCTNQLPYLWNGSNYNTTGSYNVTLTSQSGCDSIATLNLTVNQVLSSTTNASTCINQLPYVWNGNNYSTSGSYNVTLTGSNGCDSIATLNLTVKPVLTSTTTVETCTNELPYVWNGNNYTASGSYNVTLIGSNGCDSIATLNLTVKPTTSSTTNVTICTNQLPYTWNGNNYSAAGTYNVTLTGSNSCDSIATLNLTVNAVLTSTTNASVCTNQLPYIWNGINYNTTGTYNVTLTSQSGCDSIATLNLTVKPVLTSTTTASTCTNQLPFVWNGNNYTASGSYNVTLIGSNGCDSIATLNLTVKPVLTSLTNAAICNNQLPYVWNGNNYNTTGSYNVNLAGSNGCDSIATLNLTVKPVLASTTNIAICTNQLPYTWNGNSYTTGGTYNVTLTGSNGCDSIAALNLTIRPIATSSTNRTVCANQLPFIWNGNSYNTTGSYDVLLTATNGCDSIATLVLTVNASPSGAITPSNATICAGATQLLSVNGGVVYQWYLNGNIINGATLSSFNANTQGIYSVEITGANGCRAMSSNTSPLTVLQKPVANFDFNAPCQNEATVFNNSSQSGNSGTIQWNWNFGDGSTSTAQSPSHVYITPGSYTVTLIATPAQCPLLADTIKRNLVIAPQAIGERYPIVRVVKNKATELAARNIGQQYLWQPATYLNNANIQKPMITTVTDQLYLIRITTANGCFVTDTLQVQAFDKVEVFVPQAFTPNGNNANDRLRPLVVGIVTIEYFRVYNRWGQLVFETKRIGEGWDGLYKNAPQVTDTYSWIFAGRDLDGNIIKSSGKSVLIR